MIIAPPSSNGPRCCIIIIFDQSTRRRIHGNNPRSSLFNVFIVHTKAKNTANRTSHPKVTDDNIL